ncbi:Na+/H+ antiporter NhaA [Candidatus Liberibacter asiaticus]|nr:Na+/H+ antiporter NhaA [Candidatus Liberibacter asiaticus]ALK06990.1 Na+/H+ antiporter NhaA [Candidatus Liberibacter asiaticus]ASK52461.1 Na+/H+ antiporter NhaA [Candidatus Liberibacter asiaticus]AWL14542.1 Na+/H+ antiporter NhaA [Candidatus Liberibacter asiaticus]KIH95561.1 pH-dependent sodium/proton antiporter [Candidatus Liberibacter asiaticus]KPG63566.1 sodium:proton antiporter [Candidatus Liberibacter asiaticus]
MSHLYLLAKRSLTKNKFFLYRDNFTGILLISTTFITMILANISFSSAYYFDALEYKIANLTLRDWVNDILMILYFFMIGLELKHELIHGELSSWTKRSLPLLGAIGGITFPACIYMIINCHTEIYLKGWAIPTATDIAFTLGILSWIGPNIPSSLKIFFTALTMIDDFSAIAIMAIFYTQSLNLFALQVAITLIFLLFLLNRCGFTNLFIYGFLGFFLWHSIFKSGIHTTVFGVIMALLLPDIKNYHSPSNRISFYLLGDGLKSWVMPLVLPAFVFVNTGLTISTIPYTDISDPIVWGVMLGLFLGKQSGIFLFAFSTVKIGWGKLPKDTNWCLLYGGSILCGIGFTMSLFLTLQAFPNANNLQEKAKIGIILSSVISIIYAYLVFKIPLRKK